MTSPIQRPILVFKALRQLGPQSLALYARYQLGLKSGALARATPAGSTAFPGESRAGTRSVLSLPSREALAALLPEPVLERLITEAREIESGSVRLFGGEPVTLVLVPSGPLVHWTEYERGRQPWGVEDVKYIWEPGRFGWAFTLGRAYYLTGEERYAQAFWHFAETFLQANPPNLGPHWASAQEVSLRLLAFIFALEVFAQSQSSTVERKAMLAGAVAQHAARIPPTLDYARAQQNNHLLSEAAGLYTAGLALPDHPQSDRWRELGWRWFNYGLQSQISPAGVYAQHSTNYHRLVLQLALWVQALQPSRSYPDATLRRLAAAVQWLQQMLDPASGRTPNLGPNDGAYIFPLAGCPFSDYRPVVQAAAMAFLGQPACPEGEWNEMSLWLPPSLPIRTKEGEELQKTAEPLIIKSPHGHSWAYMRAARFTSRPGHADQLHLDLWWRGLNIAIDAGTYLYNAPQPWQNALSHTDVHNTLTLNSKDQMRRAGRFLWLDWAQALNVLQEHGPGGDLVKVSASHNGYRRLGVLHERQVAALPDGSWKVVDRLLPAGARTRTAAVSARLQWLLPDWEWTFEESQPGVDTALKLQSPDGMLTVRIKVEGRSASTAQAAVVRAGSLLAGRLSEGRLPYSPPEPLPHWGWVSPTYAHKQPALSFSVECQAVLPLTFSTTWLLP